MEASLNNNPLDWKDSENFFILTLTFRTQYPGRKLCKSLGLLVLVGFVVCGFGFFFVVWVGFFGRWCRERQATQHQHPFAKSRVKLKVSKGKLIYLGRKISYKSIFGKKSQTKTKQWWLIRRPTSTLYVWWSPVTKDHLFFQNDGSMCTLSFWATVCKQ